MSKIEHTIVVASAPDKTAAVLRAVRLECKRRVWRVARGP
jgi:hypothetical protein